MCWCFLCFFFKVNLFLCIWNNFLKEKKVSKSFCGAELFFRVLTKHCESYLGHPTGWGGTEGARGWNLRVETAGGQVASGTICPARTLQAPGTIASEVAWALWPVLYWKSRKHFHHPLGNLFEQNVTSFRSRLLIRSNKNFLNFWSFSIQ